MELPPRNNTNFIKALNEIFKKLPKDDVLRYHQTLVRKYVVENPHCRGIILDHEKGSGKSISSIAVAEDLKKDYKIVMLSSKSLQTNYEDDIIKYKKLRYKISDSQAQSDLKKEYTFISTKNRATTKRLQEIGVEGSVIIVDEAHNLFNGIINGSQSDLGIYNMIINAKRIKIIFLTGTPIVNSPVELMPAFNMIAGYPLFGESYRDFMDSFVDGKGRMKNRNKFQNRIVGLVSYYGLGSAKDLYPEEKPIKYVGVRMSPYQYSMYIAAREKEIKEASRKIKKAVSEGMSKSKGASSSYRVRSRQYSNFAPPEHIIRVVKKETYSTVEFDLDKLTDEDFAKLNIYAPKIPAMLSNLGKGKDVIYSGFIGFGTDLAAGALRRKGFKEIKGIEDIGNPTPSFAIISGNVDIEVRRDLVKIFNGKNNLYGEVLKILMITSTGAEGINLTEGRRIHILEPYWNYARIEQIIYRIIRANSHMRLPDKERNVQAFIYLADYPANISKKKLELTTDFRLLHDSLAAKKLNSEFRTAMHEVAIDCIIHKSLDTCKICAPTNEPLFHRDLVTDLTLPDTCKPLTEKKIKVKEILVDDKKYYYYIGEDVKVFKYNENLDIYSEVHDETIAESVREKEGIAIKFS